MRVFVAGGTGAMGRRLIPRLVANGHQVTATTTHPDRIGLLTRLGAEGVLMDGLDAASVGEAVAHARPDTIVHQMTALSPAYIGKPDFRHPEKFGATTNRLRTAGTDHLLAAADATGVSHVVAQSLANWPANRAAGPITEDETPPLEELPAKLRIVAEPLRYVEDVVVKAGGAALRYGGFYGPGGGIEDQIDLVRKRRMPVIGGGTGYFSWVHIDDAASATVLAVEQRANGVYNIVDDEPAPVSEWLPYLAACVGAKQPLRIPAWLVRPFAGEMGVAIMTQGRPYANAKAKRELGWTLRYPTWREGFTAEAAA
ncbi:NAD-dependent epimerase/dehydratase family protein [Jiangella rhizosphaerae]|uniref:NAD(P)-dependent oxidoreductase n=1 Tax=Jiangella rhizosphaerae TaxID=2293569 RepID=A0A418KN89_9ACTN|nr:NAD(P)-dependent oxidoreductase [Jiangella rhizosphaerae]RIQ20385.1 NAD(P)-dependent oxidoreductase [Jiangella rhizosphaerae]